MEISYGHDAKDCYMIYKMRNKKLDYRYEMMEKVSIEGLLPVCRVHINSEIHLKYKITSKDKVSELISRNQFTSELFHNMINTLEDIRKEFQEYFLDMDNLILNVDSIYYDRENGEFEYCYNPDYQCGYNQGIRELLEELMQKITYTDRELIGSVYDMHNGLITNTTTVKTNTTTDKANKETEKGDTSSLSNCACEMCEREEEPVGLINNIKKLFRGKKDQRSICEEEKSDKTVLLSELMATNTRKLCPINHNVEFLINSYPFMIGKNINEVDGVIEDPSISKAHARITNEGEKYWIEDLNSRNGTVVNDQRIDPYQKVNIKLGDKIEFSKYGFVFR